MVQPNQTFHFKVYIYTIFANQGFEILRKRSEMVQPNQTCHFKDLSKPIKVDLQDFKRGVGHCLLDLLRQTEV